MQQPRKPSSGVGRAGGGARRSVISESPRSFSMVDDVDEEADSSNASIYSGAAGRQSPLPLSAVMAARTAGAASQSPPMQGLLNYSHLLRSSTTSPPMTRHGTTAASPLAPVLVHGIDVQACLSHVGLQKKHHYEDTIAKMQIAALAMNEHPTTSRRCVDRSAKASRAWHRNSERRCRHGVAVGRGDELRAR
jgi:hypothetical protein